MSRVQLALRVSDLEGSVAFYSKLFGAEPAKLRPGYANFAIAEPAAQARPDRGPDDEPTRMDHLGVEVETSEEVTAATARLTDAGLVTLDRERHLVLLRAPGQGLGQGPGDEPWEVYASRPTPTPWATAPPTRRRATHAAGTQAETKSDSGCACT